MKSIISFMAAMCCMIMVSSCGGPSDQTYIGWCRIISRPVAINADDPVVCKVDFELPSQNAVKTAYFTVENAHELKGLVVCSEVYVYKVFTGDDEFEFLATDFKSKG
jgi:hypothetical protein